MTLVREGNGKPLQYSCLENPVDRRAWWAAVHRVAQSWTWLKRLKMHARTGEGNGNPLQYSCLENPRDRGVWWAAIYGVTQSWTQLKRLSSSSSMTPVQQFLLGLQFFRIKFWEENTGNYNKFRSTHRRVNNSTMGAPRKWTWEDIQVMSGSRGDYLEKTSQKGWFLRWILKGREG